MVEIKNFVYCLNINMEDGRIDIVGLMNAMTPDYIPGLFSFFVSFTLLNVEEGKRPLIVQFKDPDKKVIAKIDDAIVSYEKDKNSNLPFEQLGINVAVLFQNVNFLKSGLYSTEIILDGSSVGEYPIFVKGKNE